MNKKKKYSIIEKLSFKMTRWMGSANSVIVHTLIFTIAFGLILLGINVDRVMLILTTAVSLEAIYLSLFIQMTVNRQGKKLRDVHEDIEDLQEDIEELQDDDKAL